MVEAVQAGLFQLIDRGWHPLASGYAPDWADGWGQDQYGVFAEICIGQTMIRLRWIPPGRFTIGSPEVEPGRYSSEGPKTEIILEDGFWLMDAPVTQDLWKEVMGENPSQFKSPDRPVETVSWNDAVSFLGRVNARLDGLALRLPSEAEWEFACRADTTEATYGGPIEILGDNNAPVLDAIAWYGGNSGVDFDLKEGYDSSNWPEKQHDHARAGTRSVRKKKPNLWGCYDMLGNVFECCEDIWSTDHAGIDPTGAPRPVSQQETDQSRVIRGGSWGDYARNVRSACRVRVEPEDRLDNLGFRCAASQRSKRGQDDRQTGREAEPRPSVAGSASGVEFSAEPLSGILGDQLDFASSIAGIERRNGEGHYDWRVWLDVDASVLEKVDNVVYKLHRTFPDPIRRITDRDSKFELASGGWGSFEMDIGVEFIDGSVSDTSFFLDLGET